MIRQPRASWSDRFPNGYGITPRQRLTYDLARVLDLHGQSNEHGVDSVELATFVVAVLEAKRACKGA